MGCKKSKKKRPHLHRAIPLLVAAFLFALTLGSCGTVGGLFTEGEPTYVLVDEANVPPSVPVVPTMLEVKEPDGSSSGRTYVVAPEESLEENVPRIPIASAPPESSGWIGALSGMLAGTPIGPFAPVVGLLAAKLLATRRGRQHGANAVKALATLNVGAAAKSLVAADGWKHSAEVAPKPPAA